MEESQELRTLMEVKQDKNIIILQIVRQMRKKLKKCNSTEFNRKVEILNFFIKILIVRNKLYKLKDKIKNFKIKLIKIII